MRIRLLVLAAVAAGCARGAPEPEPAPAPEVAPSAVSRPPVAPSGYIVDPLTYCVVRNGKLEMVKLEYSVARGDSFYRGRPIAAVFPTDSTYALNAGWYRDNEPIAFARGRYVKYGLVRILSTTDVVPFGTFRGVTVFAEPVANRDRPEVIYLPVRPGCEFQPYMVLGIK